MKTTKFPSGSNRRTVTSFFSHCEAARIALSIRFPNMAIISVSLKKDRSDHTGYRRKTHQYHKCFPLYLASSLSTYMYPHLRNDQFVQNGHQAHHYPPVYQHIPLSFETLLKFTGKNIPKDICFQNPHNQPKENIHVPSPHLFLKMISCCFIENSKRKK